MHSSRQVPKQVQDTLDGGGLVLCANARSARSLSVAYGTDRLAEDGLETWRTPLILDWHAWLQSQWNRLLMTGSETRMLLSSFQEDLLWADIVTPSIQNRSLIAPAQIAPLARSAYELLGSHDAFQTLRQEVWDHTTQEPELFRLWALEMERRCERNQWLAMARLSKVIMIAIRDRRLIAPAAVLWNGFDRLTPAQFNMKTALAERGSHVADFQFNRIADTVNVTASNTTDEMEACAWWATQTIRSSPDQRVAILVPDLVSRRAELDRVLRRVTASTSGLVDASKRQPDYEFTLGVPLGQLSIIQAALLFLQWCIEPLQQESITHLLISGFFSEVHDIAALSAADIALRRKFSVPDMSMEVALERLYDFAGHGSGSWAVANWVRRVRKSRQALDSFSRAGRAGHASQWTAILVNMLEEAGWPGGHRMDTVAFQVQDRWTRALEEVATGSFDGRRYDFRSFVGMLQSHLESIIFTPESHDRPITVSGLPESAGQSFDAIWVLNMTDEAWPPRSSVHPLLPVHLQREFGMPGSSSAMDHAFGQVVFDRLRGSTASLVMSYATEGVDGAQRPNAMRPNTMRPNTMVDTLNQQSMPLEVPHQSYVDLRESFEEEMTVPWPGGRVSGGQRVLKQQSACPFQAFAATRLGAQELPSTEPGLSAADRGSILHMALQNIWGEGGIADSNQLQTVIAAGELSALVGKHVIEAFRKFEDRAVNVWEREYLQLETTRVCSLVQKWLGLESRRRPFRVQQREESKELRLGNVELTVRMDRIDEVQEGNILIDYKTGSVNKGMWAGDRPQEPQLPLYAVFGGVEGLHDVLFAQVSNEKPKFISAVFGSRPDLFPEKPGAKIAARIDAEDCFRTIREQWEIGLRTLAREFQDGLATVTPIDPPGTCKFCEYPSLCRIAESTAAVVPAEDATDD